MDQVRDGLTARVHGRRGGGKKRKVILEGGECAKCRLSMSTDVTHVNKAVFRAKVLSEMRKTAGFCARGQRLLVSAKAARWCWLTAVDVSTTE